ncbi:MAG: SDR family oxidoreductase [Pseudomonadales bacterium]|nr:SDR family oxidoreductase [Pseudomonadales bacterium]
MRVLVAGSTGYLGRYVVSELHARGHVVRALVRDPARLGLVRGCVTEVFVGQATEDASLEGVADGVDCIISCLGNRTFNRKPTVWEVDRDANLHLVERARAAAISRFIFVSVLAGKQTRSRVPQIEAREQVVDALIQGSVPWTIIRPTGFFNDMIEFLDMAAKGTAWLVGKGDSRFAPIHGADLATYIVDRLEDDAAVSSEFPVGGPELLSQREIAELAFSALNQSSRIYATPGWLVPMLALLVIPFNVNLGSFLAMLAAMAGEQDAAVVSTGERYLADFFREQLVSTDCDLRAQR